MTVIANVVVDPPAHGPGFKAIWPQPFLPGDDGLDWYVTTGTVPRKVQRDLLTDNVYTCQVLVDAGTTSFVVEDGAPTSPSTGWSEPSLAGLKLRWNGHDGCVHDADFTDTTQQDVLRDGHVERAVRRWVLSKITTVGLGNQTIGTGILGHHAYLHFRADLPDVVELEVLIDNAVAEVEVQGAGIKTSSWLGSIGFTDATLVLPIGWAAIAQRPLATAASIPATVAGYVSNAHCFPKKSMTSRRWVIYKVATSGAAQAAQDLIELKGLGRANLPAPASTLRSYHTVRAYGASKSLLPDLEQGFVGGYATAKTQAQNAFNTLNAVVQSGGTGGGTGGEFGGSLGTARMGLFHPVDEAFPGAPGGTDIEVFCARRHVREFVRYCALYSSLKLDSSALALFDRTTGRPLRTSDFGDAYAGVPVPGFVGGTPLAGQQPFAFATQNDSGYEYKSDRQQTFNGWTPRPSSWPPHFRDERSQYWHYHRWIPERQSTWPSAPRSLQNFRCNYQPMLEFVLVETGVDGANLPIFDIPNAHLHSAPTVALASYVWKDPEDAQHAGRMYTKVIPCIWLGCDLMSIDVIAMMAEYFALEYTEVGFLALTETDSFNAGTTNLALTRRLALQQSAPHTARYGTGRADAWVALLFATQFAITPSAQRNAGYPAKGIKRRCDMMFDFIRLGIITANGMTSRINYPGESGSTDRAFGGGALGTDGPPIPANYAVEQSGLELPKLYFGLFSLSRQLARTEADVDMVTGFNDYVARYDKYTFYAPLNDGNSNGQFGPFNVIATWNNSTNQPEPGATAPRSWIGSGGHFDDVSVMLEIAYRITGIERTFWVANRLGNQVALTTPPATRAPYWLNGTGQYALGLVALMQTLPGPDPIVVVTPAPTFQDIQPASALVGAAVQIHGTGFSATSWVVTIGGVALVNAQRVGDTLITGSVPTLTPGFYDVVITTSSGTAVGAHAFEVLADNPTPTAPTFTSITPNQAQVGALVTIVGTGFSASTWSADLEGATLDQLVRIGDTVIQGRVPAIATGVVDVTVTTDGGSVTAAGAFEVLADSAAPPTIDNVVPNSGEVGVALTISGTGFSAGSLVVALGHRPVDDLALFGDTLINAAVPQLAPGTYNLVVTTAAGVATRIGAFSVQPSSTGGGTVGLPPVTMVLTLQFGVQLAIVGAGSSSETQPPDSAAGAPIAQDTNVVYESTGDQEGDNVLVTWSLAGGEFRIVDGDLQRESGLAASILISLFSDARADKDPTRPITLQDLRGWWAEPTADRFGSRLWQLEREKATAETLRRAIAYARESLRWMVDQRIAREIQVTAHYEKRSTMVLQVKVLRGDARRWARLWKGALDVQIKAGNVLLQLSGA